MPRRAPSSKSSTDSVRTVNRLVFDAIERNPNGNALSSKVAGDWKSITYSELGLRVKQLSNGLRSLHIEKGDRVAILSENRPEWVIADLAILSIGAVTVPIYPSLPPNQIAHVLSDCSARAVIVEGAKQAAKITQIRADLRSLEVIASMTPLDSDPTIHTLDYLTGVGEGLADKLTPSFEELRDSVKPDDLASLVYTSGTTGNPKGAMLSHGNFFSAAEMATTTLPFINESEVFLSFLPLSHIFERVTYYLSLGMGAHTYYSEGVFKLQENMAQISPTVMQNVPRVYEAIHSRTMDNINSAPVKRQKVINWGLKVGLAYSSRRNQGKIVFPLLKLKYAIADKLVLSKIRERIGKNWRFMVSGGAPLSPSTMHFFESLGIPIVEGYGLTETSAAVVLNPVGRAKAGTVGKVLPGVKLKVASDGELLFSGPDIMQGYWKRDEDTKALIDSDGWFHTGDIGKIDKQGYVTITDRKKDIIVLANGKNVAPQPIEKTLKAAPLVAEIILLGDKSGNVSALVVPDFDQLKKWAEANGLKGTAMADLITSTDAKKAVKQQIDEHSTALADFEKIRRIALLSRPLSIDEGELTPTQKVKRKVVQEKYGHLLD